MKTKKTIAAIAALMMAVSSVSSLTLAVSANAEENVPAAAETANDGTADGSDSGVPGQTLPEAEDNIAVDPLADAGVAVQAETETVLTAEQYASLTDEEKALYAQLAVELTPDMFVTYVKEGEVTGTNIADGSYVKKGTEIYLCNPVENFYGSSFVVQHNGGSSDNFYSSYNGSDAWVKSYVINENDNDLYVSISNGASYGVLNPDEYSQLDEEMKPYYTKVYVQSPAYVWIGDDETGMEIVDGNYVLKNKYVWIAMFFEDYMDNDILINGEVANAASSGGSSNFGISYLIRPDDSEINITSQPTTCPKSAVSNDESTGIEVSYYVDDWTGGGYISDGDTVRFGTPVLIGGYKNLIAGYNIKINGEVLPLQINGDNTYLLGLYTIGSEETVITREKKDELSEYEKANFVPVYFSSDIGVHEFPFSEGNYGDEWHIDYENGDIIGKGSTLRIAVSPENYAGKVLKINGNTVSMFINGDSSNYLANYVIPDNASSLTMTLEDAPVVPNIPSAPPVVSAPTAPAAPSPSVSTASAPTAKSVVSDLKRSGSSSVSYNASEAGVTEDILTAFAKNKYAKTMTAKFDSFKVKIKKSDIEDVKALEDIDLSVNEKDFISKSQINKTKVLKESKKVVQLNFESSADISGLKKINIQAKAGKNFNDSTAAVYELKGKKLVKIGTAKVDSNGYVSFNTDHLGQFVIAVK